MQAAATKNERDGGVSISETDVSGRHVISESIGGQ
ncbi:hypothetical protein A2U01_0098943, partial [Trifolium medium]|nr:hypothetical protein [Trifolium medium]